MERLTQVNDLTRDDIVPFYVNLINTEPPFSEEVKRVNALILSKYKPSGLIYIKEKAWNIVSPKK